MAVTAVIARLAFAGIGRRRLESALTILVAAVGAATLAVALSVGAVAEEPWERTFEATRGPDVVATSFGGDVGGLARGNGVVAGAAGPFPGTLTSLRYGGRRSGVVLQARPQEPVSIDRPLVTAGTWLRDGAVVLERSYARALGVRPGERVRVAGASGPVELVVAGVALTTTQERYPESQPGLAWVLPATLFVVQPDAERRISVLFLRLADRGAADAFVERVRFAYPPESRVVVQSWRDLRAEALDDTRVNQVILATFNLLIALGIGFALATLIGGRVFAQARELGVLKATGFTPLQVGSVFLAENVLLGAAGAAGGVAFGAAISPAFVATSVELVGAGPEPLFAPLRLALAALIVLLVVAFFSFVPAWLKARDTTAAVLAPPLGAGRSRLAALASRLGLAPTALVGIKDAFSRPGRASLTALSLSLAIGAAVAALAMEATFELANQPSPPTGPATLLRDAAGEPLIPEPPAADGDSDRLRPLVYGLEAILLAIAMVTLVATTLLGVRERTQELGIMKAIGFTPRQLSAAVAANQLVLAVFALIVGIPLGLALFRGTYEAANGNTEGIGTPPLWQLFLLCPLVAGAFAALAAATARRLTRLPATESLR